MSEDRTLIEEHAKMKEALIKISDDYPFAKTREHMIKIAREAIAGKEEQKCYKNSSS